MFALVQNGAIVDRRSVPLPDGDWRPMVPEGRTLFDPETQQESVQIVIEPDKIRQVFSVVARQPTAPDVVAERNRRLALGFDYTFGDARGTHRIGTTETDMKGWDEVSKYAGALIDAGQLNTQIAIATDTGPCVVTPIEWRAIEIASAAFRQPLWAASFALMALAPTIPADYTHDSYWS